MASREQKERFLRAKSKPAAREAYRVPTRRLGVRPGVNLDKALRLAGELDDADALPIAPDMPRRLEVMATIGNVTTREKVERLLDRLSEAQLEAEYKRLQQAVKGGRAVDEWGDLDRFSAHASLGVLRHLDEEEAKVGFSWEEHRPT